MTCFQLPVMAKDLGQEQTFECAKVETSMSSKGNVLLMHGNDGPKSKAMWGHTMLSFASKGYDSLACDMRGFSPGASPNVSTAYNYNHLVGDIFGIVDAHFGAGAKFHLVGHDQGGRIGWHTLAIGDRSRLKSYTPLSEAHSDVFSDGLYGPNTDPAQQKHFMYLWLFTLQNSVVAYQHNIWRVLCEQTDGYKTVDECQHALWYYIGAVESGNLAMMPFTGDWGYVGNLIGIPALYVKANTPYALTGLPQKTKVGRVDDVPVHYVCGATDYADICNYRYAEGTKSMVGATFNYTRMNNCGHDLTGPKCPQYQQVTDAIVGFVESVS